MIPSNEQFIIESMYYIRMGSHMPVYNRPYMITANQMTIDEISNRLAASKSGKISTNTVSGLVGGLVQPSAVGTVGMIDNNWVSNHRYVFIFKIRAVDAFGAEHCTYIQGYTDYDGITSSGAMDPRMVHHINSVTETAVISYNSPLGPVTKEKLINVYNVLSKGDQVEYFTQRPTDVMDTLNTLELSSMMNIPSQDALSAASWVNPFSNIASCSSVTNNIASDYISKILNTGLMTSREREIHLGSFDTSVSSESSADRFLSEPSISGNRFLKYMSVISGFKYVRNVFTFPQISSIDPTAESRFVVLNANKELLNPYLNATPDTGEHWGGQDPVTLKAYSITEASVALAVKYGFTKLYFTASNMQNPTGQPEVLISYFNGFMNLPEEDVNYLLELFKNRFILEIFNNETSGGTIPLHLDMFVELMGTSKVNLSYGGFVSTWYTSPTAANSLYSPVMTSDKSGLDYIAESAGKLIDVITEKTTQTQRNYY